MVDTVAQDENKLFEIAEKFIVETSKCIFLTGKAGTGKTTFLKHIRRTVRKNTVVVAPTGVAAINAGGVTIHSFFQLPFTPFVPFGRSFSNHESLFDRFAFLQNLKIDHEKRSIFRELELLIIDEVSMVRCDVLDAMDTILRHFRKREHLPFGGVQVLFIGDLFQLPPVVPDEQWNLLRSYYDSPFFFDSLVIRKANPVYIELKKIYRQTDPAFISLLNKVRNNLVGEAEIDLLNKNYNPVSDLSSYSGYVTLTSHNYKADNINRDELNRLPGPEFVFNAELEGDFPDRLYPTDKQLVLKVGAQVMFIKNDPEKIRRYYNGKIGFIKSIEENKVVVNFPEEDAEIEVGKETWGNVRYSLNYNTRNVEEEVLGTFTQYSIRLAWAVTIHKSQGLTFDKVIIDAGKSFAAGQVYVALSRCTSLDGIILHSPITRAAIMTDERVLRFAEEELSPERLQPVLQFEKRQHKITTLLNVFDWSVPLAEVQDLYLLVKEKKKIDLDNGDNIFDELIALLSEQIGITERFSAQIHTLNREQNFTLLHERVEAAVNYYSRTIDEKIIQRLKKYEDELLQYKRVKKLRKRLNELMDMFNKMKKIFEKTKVVSRDFINEN